MKKKFRKIIAAISLCAIAVTSPGNMAGLFNNTGTVKATSSYFIQTYTTSKDGIEWNVTYCYYPGNEAASYSVINSAKLKDSTSKTFTIPDYLEFDTTIGNNPHVKIPITKIPNHLFEKNSTIESITLGSNVTEIGACAFSCCSNLKSVSQANHNEQSNIITIGYGAFEYCDKLENLDFNIGDIDSFGLYMCTSLKEIKDFYGSKIGMISCWNSGIEKFDFSKCTNLTIDLNALAYTKLKELHIPCDVTLASHALYECLCLQKAEFDGKVNAGMYTFQNSFKEEYKNGNLIDKSIVFHDDVKMPDYSQNNTEKNSSFAGCNGLTKIVFEKNAELGSYMFQYTEMDKNNAISISTCPNLKDIEFQGDVTLGKYVFTGAPKLNTTMRFPGNVYSDYEDAQSSPFACSTITDVIFDAEKNDTTIECNFWNDDVQNVTYGKNVSTIKGRMRESGNGDYVQNVLFLNPNVDIQLLDYQEKKHNVYGFSSYVRTNNNPKVENWIDKNYYSQSENYINIVDKLIVEEPDTYYGAIDKKDIDFNNLSVKYIPTYANSEKYEIVPCETEPSKIKNVIDDAGYIVHNPDIPDTLTPRDEAYTFTITFSSVKSDFIHIKVEDIIPQKLDIDWKTDNIKELVASDDVKIQDVVSGVAVTYNNGEVKEFTSADLDNFTLENTTTHNDTVKAGKNTFAVTYHETSKYIKDEDGNYKNYKVSASKEFDIQENYVTAINAELVEKTRYVGDTITKDDIILRATYKNDKDTTVPKEVEPSSIENVVLTASGTSIVVVNYGDLQTKVEVPTKELVPTKIAASFEKTNAYIEGQKEFDLDAFHVAVTYNSGLVKDNYDKKNLVLTKENCKVETLVSTSTEIKVKMVYMENGVSVDTTEIVVPVTPKKLTEISAVSKVDSMVEGTIFPQSNLEALTLTYNNGNTETLDATSLDFDQLEIQQDKIVADQDNEIKITYQGVSTTITVHGVKKEIESVEAKYMGQPVVVGQYLKLSDVEVTVFYNNGQSEVLSSGYVVKDADCQIVKVGDNEIKVYYDTFEATIIVPGITEDMNIVSSHVPTSTSIVTTGNTTDHTEVMNTIAPTNNAEQTTTNNAEPTTTNNAEPTTTNLAVNTIPSTVISTFNITSNIKNLVLGQTTKTVYTNKTVQLQIASDKISNLQYQLVTTKLSNKAWKNLSDTKLTVKKAKTPTVVYFRYTDATGKTITTQTIQFVIDKIKPSVNVKKGKTYKKGFKLQFNDVSGISYAKLDGKKVKNNTKITKKGLHKIIILDKAGNKKIVKFKVK